MVNSNKRGRPKGENKISREAILEVTTKWMLHENKSISIRKIAKQLDVDPMAIYYYFENKSELLKATATSLMELIYVPNQTEEWRVELETLCLSYVELLQNNSGLLETFLSMGDDAHAPAKIFQGRFELATSTLILDREDQSMIINLLVDYLHGVVAAIHYAKGEIKSVVIETSNSLNLIFEIIERKSTIQT